MKEPGDVTTVADYIIQQLSAWGIGRIYGVVGDTLFPLLDAIARHPAVRFVAVRHEAAAGLMASAEAKLTGQVAACLATSGPGIVNLLNGLADAAVDRAPVLAISGQVESNKIGTGAKQYLDQQSLLRPLAVYTALLAHPDAAGQVLPTALRQAVAQGRVAHLSLPKDLLALPCTAAIAPPEPWLLAPPTPGLATVSGALAVMAGAQKPLILMGQGARPAADGVLALAERWGAGILQSLPAKGAIPWSHPLVLGGLGEGGTEAAHQALREADLVLTLACTWWPQAYVPRDLPVIKVDREAANIGEPVSPLCGIAADVALVVPDLCAGIAAAARREWRARLGQLKQAWQTVVESEVCPEGPPLSPQRIVREVEQALPPDAIVTLDTGDHTVWFNRIFGGEQHQVLVSGTWRTLGFGLPAALAAKLSSPTRTVAAIVGDAGLQSLMGELVTAAELGLQVITVVINNRTMAIEEHRAALQGHSTLGTTPLHPDFGRLATACGLTAYTARTARELAEALRAALSGTGPALVDALASAPVAPTASS